MDRMVPVAEIIQLQQKKTSQSEATKIKAEARCCETILLGRRRRRYPSLDAFVDLAAPTEAKRPAVSTFHTTRCKTKTYDEVAPSRVLVQHEAPRGIRPIVIGPARLSVLRAQFVKAFL
jgi:hypothetical protein